jgi:hypothetical protein
MKLQQISMTIAVIAGSALALSTNPAQAFSFNSGTVLGSCTAVPLENLTKYQVSAGVPSCTTADGFTLTAGATTPIKGGAKLTIKKVNNVKAVGVFNDKSNQGNLQEIDYGEAVSLFLNKASILKSLDLAFLYKKDVKDDAFDDVVNEVAQVWVGNKLGTLTVKTATTAEWMWDNNPAQLLTAISNSDKTGAGWYSILNPFGDTEVSLVTLTSPKEKGRSFEYSDYALVGAETATEKVPEPTTLMGLGLLGSVFVMSRRRKPSKAC